MFSDHVFGFSFSVSLFMCYSTLHPPSVACPPNFPPCLSLLVPPFDVENLSAELKRRRHPIPSPEMAPQSTTSLSPLPSPLPKPEIHHFPVWAIAVIVVVAVLIGSLVFYLFTQRHNHAQKRPARAVARGSRAPSSTVRGGQRIG